MTMETESKMTREDTIDLTNKFFYAIQESEGELITECHKEFGIWRDRYRFLADRLEKIAQEEAKREAVNFIEYVANNLWSYLREENVWIRVAKKLTTAELFELYLNEKGK